jgi:hypothetical protein
LGDFWNNVACSNAQSIVGDGARPYQGSHLSDLRSSGERDSLDVIGLKHQTATVRRCASPQNPVCFSGIGTGEAKRLVARAIRWLFDLVCGISAVPEAPSVPSTRGAVDQVGAASGSIHRGDRLIPRRTWSTVLRRVAGDASVMKHLRVGTTVKAWIWNR